MGRKRVSHTKKRSTGEKGESGMKSISRQTGGAKSPALQEGAITLTHPGTGKEFVFYPAASEEQKLAYYDKMREFRDWKAEQQIKAGKKPTAKGGAPTKIDKAIDQGKFSKRDMWEWWDTYEKQQKYNFGQIMGFIAEKLTRERAQLGLRWKIAKKSGLVISPETVTKWYKDPANRREERPELKTVEQFKTYEEWQKYDKATELIKKSTRAGYDIGIQDFIKFRQQHKQTIDPVDWTESDYWDWLKQRVDVDGLSSNTMRGYAVGWRQFMAHGMGKSPSFLRSTHLKSKWTEKKKPRPGTIRFIPVVEYDKMINAVPMSNYKVTYKSKGKMQTRYYVIKDETDRLEVQTAFRMMSVTGARAGNFPTGIWWSENMTSARYLDLISKNCTGNASIRLEDIKFNTKLPVIDPNTKKRYYEKGITSLEWIMEKHHLEWGPIPLSDKTSETLDKYIRSRYKLAKNVDLNNFLLNESEDRKEEFLEYRDSLIPQLQEISKIKAEDVREGEMKLLGEKLKHKYQKSLLLYTTDARKMRDAMYVTLQHAIDEGNPILDDQDRPWTPTRLIRENIALHLWRKSFVQNQMAYDVPLERISDLGVGWTDLTTLKDYYGRIPPAALNTTFIRVTKEF